MQNKTLQSILIVLSFFLGCVTMYFIVYYFPITIFKDSSKENRIVTVTEEGISSGIENIYDAIVVVENYRKGKLIGIGSGFIYSGDGYIMTNHHVVDKADEIKIITSANESLEAKVLGSDEYADIAVIQIDKTHIKKIAKIGNSTNMRVGDTVFTIGSPMSADFSGTVTRGILSGKNRMVEVSVSNSTSNDWIMNVMQTDAAINPGNSGGPLCNISGEVIGINSMKIVQSEIEGIGFSIPIEDAMQYASKIVKGEKVKRSYLGVQMTDVAASNYNLKREGITLDPSIVSGVIVMDAIADGPCKKAGIIKGDVIVKIGEYEVRNVAELRYYLYKYSPDTEVEIKVKRNKNDLTFKVKLGVSD